jgi:tetratricopeptide (TPR) repeat protein
VGQFKGISQTIPVYEAIGIGHFDDLAFDQDFKKDELKVYEKIVKNNPDLLWLILDLAHYYFDQEEYSKSSEKYQQVIEILPDFAPAHMYLGRCWFRQYRYEEAKYSLERALQLNPLSPRANNFLAVCLRRLAYKYRQDDPKEGKELFKTALELHDLAKQRVKKNEPPYIWSLNGLARTIAEAEHARGHFSLDEAQGFAETALNLIKIYRGQTKNKGKEINKEHLVLDTIGYIYLKRWEAVKNSGKITADAENLLKRAEENFNNALKSVNERKAAAGDDPGIMGNRNYSEKLSEIYFHLAKLYYKWNEFKKRKKFIRMAKQQAELAKQTAKKINDEFLQNQYWYGEVQEILNKLSSK